MFLNVSHSGFDNAYNIKFRLNRQFLTYPFTVDIFFWRNVIGFHFRISRSITRRIICKYVKWVFAKVHTFLTKNSFFFLVGLPYFVLLIPASPILIKSFVSNHYLASYPPITITSTSAAHTPTAAAIAFTISNTRTGTP